MPGTPVDRLELSDAHLAAGAALLAAIHLSKVPDRLPQARTVSTEGARVGIETALRALLDAGAVEEPVARRLRAAAALGDPRTAPAGITHTDLCAENLVVDPRGMVRAVDNEGLRIEPTGFDLGRVWYRWPIRRGIAAAEVPLGRLHALAREL